MAAIRYKVMRVDQRDMHIGLQVGDIVIKAGKQHRGSKTISCMLPDHLKGKGTSGAFVYGAKNYWQFCKSALQVEVIE